MATFTASFGLAQYRLRLEINEGTIDIPNNRSIVNWALYVDKLSGSGYYTGFSGNTGGISGSVSGSANGWAPYDFTAYSSRLIGSGSQWVVHDSDGTKVASGSYFANDSAGDNFGSASGSWSLALTPIPQASMQRYDGTTWKNQVLERWTGSAWARQILERWTGSVWTRQM